MNFNDLIINSIQSNVGLLLIVLGILILLFLIAREILLWYWRINDIVDLLEEIKLNTTPDERSKMNSVDMTDK